jgi:hypothetical protein
MRDPVTRARNFLREVNNAYHKKGSGLCSGNGIVCGWMQGSDAGL